MRVTTGALPLPHSPSYHSFSAAAFLQLYFQTEPFQAFCVFVSLAGFGIRFGAWREEPVIEISAVLPSLYTRSGLLWTKCICSWTTRKCEGWRETNTCPYSPATPVPLPVFESCCATSSLLSVQLAPLDHSQSTPLLGCVLWRLGNSQGLVIGNDDSADS